jgi:hypothetical protein
MLDLYILALGAGAAVAVVVVTIIFSILLAAILDPVISIDEDDK